MRLQRVVARSLGSASCLEPSTSHLSRFAAKIRSLRAGSTSEGVDVGANRQKSCCDVITATFIVPETRSAIAVVASCSISVFGHPNGNLMACMTIVSEFPVKSASECAGGDNLSANGKSSPLPRLPVLSFAIINRFRLRFKKKFAREKKTKFIVSKVIPFG